MAEEAAAAVVTRERKIMVGVDMSEESMYALSWCLNNLISHDSNIKDTLILLYAIPPPVVYSALDGTGYLYSSDIITTMERYGKEVAETVMVQAKKICRELLVHQGEQVKVKVETRVEEGDAREVICQMVEKLSVDILVLGSHGYGAIKRAFLGSVSNHCAQSVKCPVLIAKRPKSHNGSNSTKLN